MPPRLRSAAPAGEPAQPPPQQRVTTLPDLSDELLAEFLEQCVTDRQHGAASCPSAL
jgi:hypothetical protein